MLQNILQLELILKKINLIKKYLEILSKKMRIQMTPKRQDSKQNWLNPNQLQEEKQIVDKKRIIRYFH